MSKYGVLFLILFGSLCSFSQTEKEKKQLKEQNNLIVTNNSRSLSSLEMNPLAPAKAAFYSAILPGLGQAYNKKYWMIPVIYAGMAWPMYYYNVNNKRYDEFITAYKLELAGKPHQFPNYDKTALESGINSTKKNRDLSLFITIGVYILNIVEANVDAHLPNRKIDTNISYRPSLLIDPITNNVNVGASVSFSF